MVHLFSFLRASKGSKPPSVSIARGAACQHPGIPGQSTPLLPEPADGEEAPCKTRCDCLFWCQSLEQVTFTSVPAPPQRSPFPHHTKMGDPSLAQHPHKSSSSAPQASTVIITSTLSSVTVNFSAQLQQAEHHDLCQVESQKRYISLHSGNAIHLCYQLPVI